MASIKKRPDGRWRARYRDEAGKEHARHFRRQADAQRWLDEVTAAVVTGTYVDPKAGKVTFAAFAKDWASRQVWTETTADTNTYTLGWVPFSDKALGTLRRSHIELWVKEMIAAGLAPSTIKTRFVTVRSVLNGAVMDKVIATNPANGIRLPAQRKAEAAMTIPTSEQVRAALADAAENDPRFYAFVAVAAFAGLRLGEIAGLQVGDVDFLRKTIRVERQIQGKSHRTTTIVPPKYGSERTVYVPEELTNIIAAHVAEHGMTWDRTHPDQLWLFGADGWVYYRGSAGHRWTGIRERAGLDAFTLHDLRHYFASGLIADGCDVVTVSRALGHKRPSVTLNVYAHLWPTAEDKTRNAASNLARGVLADSVRTSAAT